jgi:hypothetical protein
LNKSAGYRFGTGYGGSDDHGGRTQMQGHTRFVGICDVAFYQHRDSQIGQDGLDKWP